MNKKLFLGMGTAASVLAPIVAVVSCGKEKATNSGTDHSAPATKEKKEQLVASIKNNLATVASNIVENFGSQIGVSTQGAVVESTTIAPNGDATVNMLVDAKATRKRVAAHKIHITVVVKANGNVEVKKEGTAVSKDIVKQINESPEVKKAVTNVQEVFAEAKAANVSPQVLSEVVKEAVAQTNPQPHPEVSAPVDTGITGAEVASHEVALSPIATPEQEIANIVPGEIIQGPWIPYRGEEVISRPVITPEIDAQATPLIVVPHQETLVDPIAEPHKETQLTPGMIIQGPWIPYRGEEVISHPYLGGSNQIVSGIPGAKPEVDRQATPVIVPHPYTQVNPSVVPSVDKQAQPSFVVKADDMATTDAMKAWLLDLTQDEFNAPGQPESTEGAAPERQIHPTIGQESPEPIRKQKSPVLTPKNDYQRMTATELLNNYNALADHLTNHGTVTGNWEGRATLLSPEATLGNNKPSATPTEVKDVQRPQDNANMVSPVADMYMMPEQYPSPYQNTVQVPLAKKAEEPKHAPEVEKQAEPTLAPKEEKETTGVMVTGGTVTDLQGWHKVNGQWVQSTK